jgi:hypothetical protein
VARMKEKGPRSRSRRRRKRGGGAGSSVLGWTFLFIVLLNIGALLVFDPVRDPLDFESYLQEDALVHFGAFFVCTAIGGPLLLRWFSLGIISVGLVGFGIAAEIVQGFTADRTADFVDFVADEAGVLAALLLIGFVRQLRRWVSAGNEGPQGSRLDRDEYSDSA